MNLSKFIYYNTCIFLLTSLIAFAQNRRAIEDGFDLLEDGDLIVDSEFGVLSNDVLGGGSAIAILKSGPKNGEVDFRRDGSFTYTPNFNFNGVDSFTYSFQSQPEILEFVVGESRSEVDFSAKLTAIGLR